MRVVYVFGLAMAGCTAPDLEGAAATSGAPPSAGSERPELVSPPSPSSSHGVSTPSPPAGAASARAASFTPRSRPTAEEWKAAPERTRAGGCRADGLGDWVRLSCKDGYWTSRGGDWGRASADYFEGLGATMELRLRPGMLAYGAHSESAVRVVFAWPSGYAEPLLAMRETSGKLEPRPAPQPLPLVPNQEVEKPSEADWYVATPVNTASSSPAKQCSLFVKGQWARLECACQLAAVSQWSKLDGFGDPVKDVSRKQLVTPNQMIRLDFRLQQGGRGRAEVSLGAALGDPDVSVEYEWPNDAAQPTVLAFREKFP